MLSVGVVNEDKHGEGGDHRQLKRSHGDDRHYVVMAA
jgi:hypothetical protein